MFIQAIQAPQTPWQALLQWLPSIGWTTVIGGIISATWKLRGFLADAKTRTTKAEEQLTAVVTSNGELKDLLKSQVDAQKELATSVHQLADAIHQQADRHAEQLGLIREMMAEQKLLGQNQMVIMNGFQRVVEQLIDAVKE